MSLKEERAFLRIEIKRFENKRDKDFLFSLLDLVEKQDKQFLEDLKKEIQMGHTCEMFCPHNEMIKQVDKLSGYVNQGKTPSKFKMGDKVKVKDNVHSIHKGQKGRISAVQFGLSIKFDEPTSICKEHGFSEDELEFVKQEKEE